MSKDLARLPLVRVLCGSARQQAIGPKTGLLVLLLLSALLSGSSCVSSGDLPSVWPPEDFYLEVEQQVPVEGHMRVSARFQVWADGLAVYREADGVLLGPERRLDLPLFRRACAFELKPESTRMLARMLYLRGVLDLEALQGDPKQDQPTDAIGLVYNGFGQSKTVTARGEIRGSAVSVMRAVNAFLPDGAEFTLRGLRGGNEVRRLDGVPAPLDDLAGSLELHQSLFERTGNSDLLIDAFALACALDRREVAEDLFERLATITVPQDREATMFPEDDDRITADDLRPFLDQH